MEHSQNSLTSERPNEGIRTPLQGNTTPKNIIYKEMMRCTYVTLSFYGGLCHIRFAIFCSANITYAVRGF